MRAAPMARLDEQPRVRAHERYGHRELGSIRRGEIRVATEPLDDAEQVVPAARVQPGGMLAKLVQDLVHLECGGDRLDEDGRADGTARDAELSLGMDEHLVPQPSLMVRFELGQVEVRPRATRDALGRVVEEIEAGIEEQR